jgi:hypothetical protein
LCATKVRVISQGKLLTVSITDYPYAPPQNVKRGIVDSFSRASRLRLLKYIATIDWESIASGVLITLTYPDSRLGRDKDTRNKDRSRFLRDIEKHLGGKVSGIWRTEYEPRKSGANQGVIVPHLHFLLIRESFVCHKVVRKIWRKILKVHGPLSTDVRAAKNGELASFYIAKYMSKVHSLLSLDNCAYLNTHGRHWGTIRKQFIPICPHEVLDGLDEDEIAFLIATGQQRLPWVDMTLPHTFSLLGKNATEILSELRKKILDRTHPIREDA